MTYFLTFIGRRFLELGFFILGFPIAVGLFVLVATSWSVVFVPLFAVLILVLLHAMQWVAWFEVKRANLFLRREIRVVDQWFSYRFFSWMGVKERLLSARSWLTIVYLGVSFLIGVIGFALSVTALALFVTVFVVPIGAVVAWSRGTVVLSNDIDLIAAFTEPGQFVIGGVLSDVPLPMTVTLITIALLAASVFAGALVWLLGLLQAHVVNGFLSNGYLPALRRLTQRATSKLRVNEREVQDALNHPQTRESLAELSPREKEVLALMAQGKSNAGIASALFITEGSVEKHVSNILSKMELSQNGDQHRRVLAVLEYLGIEPGEQESASAPRG
jgi:DNA-binding CsgD family transcriptional regulator